jgi:hypothetical protein
VSIEISMTEGFCEEWEVVFSREHAARSARLRKNVRRIGAPFSLEPVEDRQSCLSSSDEKRLVQNRTPREKR